VKVADADTVTVHEYLTCPLNLLLLHKGNPASTAYRKNPLFTPKMTVVCTWFTVLAAFLKSINSSRDASWMA
jgi:hypothetical protein